jgi:hypothetical protein
MVCEQRQCFVPSDYRDPTPGNDTNVFTPLTLEWYRNAQVPGPVVEDRFFSYLYVFGRLRPGVSLNEAQAKLDASFRAIINEVEAPAALARPGFDKEAEFRARTLALLPGVHGQSGAPVRARTPLAVFFAATATILLIACINLANLMFARSAARTGEIAVRASLGAARHRLYALLSIEALLLASLGALLSLPVALGVLRAVDALQPPGLRVIAVDLDARMLAAALAVGVLSAVVFALAPMAKLVGADPARALLAFAAWTHETPVNHVSSPW